jgi:hypothetical protein
MHGEVPTSNFQRRNAEALLDGNRLILLGMCPDRNEKDEALCFGVQHGVWCVEFFVAITTLKFDVFFGERIYGLPLVPFQCITSANVLVQFTAPTV